MELPLAPTQGYPTDGDARHGVAEQVEDLRGVVEDRRERRRDRAARRVRLARCGRRRPADCAEPRAVGRGRAARQARRLTRTGEALEPSGRAQAWCRINEISSRHQKQRFVIEIVARGIQQVAVGCGQRDRALLLVHAALFYIKLYYLSKKS